MHNFKHVPEIKEILSLSPAAKVFLFDMDGTLINTEQIHAKAFLSLIDREKLEEVSLEKLYDMCLGQTDARIFTILQENKLVPGGTAAELRIRKNSLYKSLLQEVLEEEICLPQIRRLLTELKDAGHKIALVTSSDLESAEASMKRFGFDQFFSLYVTEETTELNKPHPQPYMFACEKLGAKPNECVVFEDSPTGLAAAKDFSPGAIIQASWY